LTGELLALLPAFDPSPADPFLQRINAHLPLARGRLMMLCASTGQVLQPKKGPVEHLLKNSQPHPQCAGWATLPENPFFLSPKYDT